MNKNLPLHPNSSYYQMCISKKQKSDIIIINIIRQPKPVSWFETISLISRVGYRLNFIDSDSDSAYRFRFFSIPSFDSNVINNDIKHLSCLFFCKPFIGAEYHEQKSTGYIKTGLFKSCLCAK